MKKLLSSGLAIGAMVSLVGCGGGSSTTSTPTISTPTVSGNLFNTYVEGATYVCSSGKTGTTDNMGTYTCNVGDTVEFFLGKYSIGSANAAEGILDTDLLSADDAADTDLLQLLQGIDDESDGVITIPEDFTALDEITVPLGDSTFETVIASDTNIILEDEKTAVDNHAENLLQVYLGDKTLYLASPDLYVDKWVFDENLTEVNATYVAGQQTGDSVIIDLLLENGWLSISNSGHIEFVEETADYLLFNHTMDTVTTEMKFYFDEAVANAVYQGIILITQEKLDGKTFYSYEYDDYYQEAIYAEMTFSAGTLTRTEVINGSAPETFTVPYEIIDGKIRADVPAMDGDPSEYAWVTLLSETADSWIILDEGDNNQDGTIDWTSETTLYLTKPDTYPDFTATTTTTSTSTTTPTDTTTSTSTTTTEAALRELLAGKTLYNESNYEAWTFNADVTSFYWEDVDAINVQVGFNAGTETFILSGTTATLNGGMVVTLEIFDQYITMSTGTQSENLWYNLTEMESANPELLQF